MKEDRKTLLDKMVEDKWTTRQIMEHQEFWDCVVVRKEDFDDFRELFDGEENIEQVYRKLKYPIKVFQYTNTGL